MRYLKKVKTRTRKACRPYNTRYCSHNRKHTNTRRVADSLHDFMNHAAILVAHAAARYLALRVGACRLGLAGRTFVSRRRPVWAVRGRPAAETSDAHRHRGTMGVTVILEFTRWRRGAYWSSRSIAGAPPQSLRARAAGAARQPLRRRLRRPPALAWALAARPTRGSSRY